MASRERLVTHRRDIDGLRALAVLLVMFHHAGFGFSGGFVGVDVFFVISGFLITQILVKELDQGTFSFWKFWQRRLLRIMPALLTVVTLTFAVMWRILLPWDFNSFARTVPASIFGYANIQFWGESGYFDSAAQEKPLLHAWSLAVEEQFYLLIPLILAWLHGSKFRPKISFFFLGLFCLSLITSISLTRTNPSFSFYWLPTRAWELLAGSLLAHFQGSLTKRLKCNGLSTLLGLTLILVPAFFYGPGTVFPGLAAIPPVLGTVLIIAKGTEGGPSPIRILEAKPMVAIGTISYSLYLVHWPPLAIASYLEPEFPSWVIRLSVFLISFPAAYLLWQWVEKPWRLRSSENGDVWRTRIVISMGLLLFISAFYVRKGRGLPERFDAHMAGLMASKEMDFRWWLVNHLPEDLPENMIRLGPDGETPEILLWGDSHAKVLLPGLELACAKNRTGLAAAVHDGSPPVAGLLHGVQRMGPERFQQYSEKVIETAINLGVRKVILAGYWEAYAAGRQEDLRHKLFQTVARLNKEGIEVFFVRDVPSFSVHPNKILVNLDHRRVMDKNFSISHEDYLNQNHFQESVLVELEAMGVHFLNPLPYLRGELEDEYSLMDRDGIRYWDQNHLSRHGSLVVEPMFDKLFTSKGQVASGNDFGAPNRR